MQMGLNDAVVIDKNGNIDEEANLEREAMDEWSTDTKTFRIMMYSEIKALKDRVNWCGISPQVAKMHDNKLQMLEKSDAKLQKGQSHLVAGQVKLSGELSLLKQSIEFGNQATLKAIKDLEKGRDANAKSAGRANETAVTLKEKVAVIQAEKKTLFMMIGVGFAILMAVVSTSLTVWGLVLQKQDKKDIGDMQTLITTACPTACPFKGKPHIHDVNGNIRLVK